MIDDNELRIFLFVISSIVFWWNTKPKVYLTADYPGILLAKSCLHFTQFKKNQNVDNISIKI